MNGGNRGTLLGRIGTAMCAGGSTWLVIALLNHYYNPIMWAFTPVGAPRIDRAPLFAFCVVIAGIILMVVDAAARRGDRGF